MGRDQYVTVCAGDTECLHQLAGLGRSIADESGHRLRIMLFAGRQKECRENARLLEYVFDCAKRLDAEMNVYYTEQPVERLAADGSEYIVVGGEGEMAGEIRRRLPGKRLVVME